MVGRRGTGRSQSAERILDEERAFTRAELVNYSTRSIHALDLSIYLDTKHLLPTPGEAGQRG